MIDLTISVTQRLTDKFGTALEYYNEKDETEYTPKQMVKRLARQFVIVTIRELRISKDYSRRIRSRRVVI